MNIQQVRQEVWYALSVVIMAVVVSNFAFHKVSKFNPDLLEIVLGSTRLERFAEAVGYYTPVANADSVQRAASDPSGFTIDVLNNDTFERSVYYSQEPGRLVGLRIERDTQISNLTATPDAGVEVIVVPREASDPFGNQTSKRIEGKVRVDVDSGFEGVITFDYQMCAFDDSGNTRSEECATAPVTIQVGEVNQPPELNDATVSMFEDGVYRFEIDDFDETSPFGNDLQGYSDPEDVPYTRVRIESLPQTGVLKYDENPITADQLFLEIGRNDVNRLTYTPPENFNADLTFGSSSEEFPAFAFNVRDEAQYASESAQMSIFIESVNDAPVVEDFTVEFAHDTSWYFNMPDNADDNCFSARYSDVDEQSQGVNEAWELGGLRLMSEPEHGALFVYPDGTGDSPYAGEPYAWTEGRVIARDDIESMRFIPEAGYVGTDTFDWQATDELIEESGIAGPAVDYAWSNTATTTLNIANTSPSLSDVTIQADEDSTVEFTPEQFEDEFSDAEDDPLTAIRIATLPSEGDLVLNDTPVTAGQEIIRDDIASLRFTPPENYNGRIRFDYNATDGFAYAETNREVFVIVGPQEDVPVASNFSFDTAYNTPYEFRVENGETLFEQNFVDEADEATQAGEEDYFLADVEIMSLPANGVLRYTRSSDEAAVEVAVGDRILTAELQTLVYTPNRNFTGQDSFTWRGHEIDQQEQIEAFGTPLRPQEISNVATASVTVANYENLRIAITKDTPDEEVEVNKIVCVQGEVVNPNAFALENAVVRLTTDPNKAPFVENSFTLPAGKTYKNLVANNAEFSLTFDRIELQESVLVSNCVRPLTQDLSVVDASTFLEGSDRVSNQEVTVSPGGGTTTPDTEEEAAALTPENTEKNAPDSSLIRTGGQPISTIWKTFWLGLVLAGVYLLKRAGLRKK